MYRSNERDKGFTKLTTLPIVLSSTTGGPMPGFRDTTGIMPKRTYWYKLSSRDVFGNVTYTAPVSAVPYDSTPPGPPTISSIRVDSKRRVVSVSWEQANTKDVAGFFVYSSGEVIHTGQRANKNPLRADIRTYSFRLQPARAVMWFRVSAIDSYRNEAFSLPNPARIVE